MIALTVVVLISLISLPLFITYQKTTKLKSESRILVSNLRLAQQLAITEQNIYDLKLFPDTKTYQIINEKDSSIKKTVVLNPEVSIAEVTGFTANTIRFVATGAVIETGTILLSNTNNNTTTLQIKPSGYVELSE